VVYADFGTDANALDAMPGLGISVALKKVDVVAGFVTGRRDAQGVKRTIRDRTFDAAEVKVATEQFAQWRVIEQRLGAAANQPAQGQHGHPVRTGEAESERIGAINIAGVHVAPEAGQHRNALAEIVGHAGDACGIDGARGRAAQDGEGIPSSIA